MIFKLFKYTSAQNARLCLTNNSIWFSRAASLNDPLETRFTPVAAEEFLSSIQSAVAKIEQMTGAPPSHWQPNLSEEFLEITNRENVRLAAFCREMGVFSAGRQPDHQAMWAYYANDGRGLCFELDLSEAIAVEQDMALVEVKYGGGLRPHNRADDLAEIMLEVAEDNPGISLSEIWQVCCTPYQLKKLGVHTAMRAAARKHEHWQQERELRLIKPRPGELPILDRILRRVHIMKPDAPDVDECLKLLDQRYPAIPIVQWSFDDTSMHMVSTILVDRR